MGRVHHCIQGGNVLGSALGKKTVAWDASEGMDSKASGRIHTMERVACKSNIGKQGERREGWGRGGVGAG